MSGIAYHCYPRACPEDPSGIATPIKMGPRHTVEDDNALRS